MEIFSKCDVKFIIKINTIIVFGYKKICILAYNCENIFDLNVFVILDQKDVYRYPVVTSQEIGYWRKNEPIPINEPWAVVPRRVFRKSEMTR